MRSEEVLIPHDKTTWTSAFCFGDWALNRSIWYLSTLISCVFTCDGTLLTVIQRTHDMLNPWRCTHTHTTTNSVTSVLQQWLSSERGKNAQTLCSSSGTVRKEVGISRDVVVPGSQWCIRVNPSHNTAWSHLTNRHTSRLMMMFEKFLGHLSHFAMVCWSHACGSTHQKISSTAGCVNSSQITAKMWYLIQ